MWLAAAVWLAITAVDQLLCILTKVTHHVDVFQTIIIAVHF